MKNSISFRLWGAYALFTDPVTKIGGEKFSYHIPTCEAIKGVLKSIYWKPTIVWSVDKVRVMKPLQTESKGIKPLNWTGGNDLSIYAYLKNVEYQVLAHFEWNLARPEMEKDRINGKHYAIITRTLEKGGRQDIFLGARECQGYVEPCDYGSGSSAYDDIDELSFGLMFHSFGYPDEAFGEGVTEDDTKNLNSFFWHAVMKKGELIYPKQSECLKKTVRPMDKKAFTPSKDVLPAKEELSALGGSI